MSRLSEWEGELNTMKPRAQAPRRLRQLLTGILLRHLPADAARLISASARLWRAYNLVALGAARRENPSRPGAKTAPPSHCPPPTVPEDPAWVTPATNFL